MRRPYPKTMSTAMSILPPPQEKPQYVNRMFAAVAPTYDLLNRLITGWQDVRWRREVIALCDLPPHGRFLDVGTGTGDLAAEAVRRHPSVTAVGCDFTYEMMAHGRHKASGRIHFVQGDALDLPFPDATFDAVASGFLLRNVADVDRALREQVRVTKPGGRVVCLETTPPESALLEPLVRFHLLAVIPALGRLLSPAGDAYTYLPQSTVHFLKPQELAHRMERAGLAHVFFQRRMFGTVAIHVGMVVAA